MRIYAALWTVSFLCFFTPSWADSPQITLNGESFSRVAVGSVYQEVSATATDAEDGAIQDVGISYSHPSWLTRKEEMVAWWRFEDNGKDETGNGNDGQLVSNATYGDGKFGRALELPHDGSHMLIQNFNGVPVGAEFSISAWILPNDISSGGNADGAIFSTNNTILYWINFDAASGSGPASPSFLVGSTANEERVNGPPNALHALDWQHVLVVMNGKTRRLYIDGVLAAIQNNGVTTARNIHGQNIQLGAWGGSTNMWYDGKMDDVRVYDVALEDADVAKIYGINGVGDLGDNAMDTSLVGLWTVTFSATDTDGNVGTVTRTVEVYDPDAPEIHLVGELEIRVEQGTDYIEPGYTILDSEGGNAINGAEAVVTTTLDTHLAGVYLIHYDYTDGDGKSASQVTREITVSDTIDPTLTLHEAATLKHPVGKPFLDPGGMGMDSADGELAVVSSLWTQGQLLHRGYTPGWPEQELNFHKNGGLLAGTPRGEDLLQSALNFANDADFRAPATGIPGNDNFSNLFLGHFVANKSGTYEFGIERADDRATLWLDLDQDGVFEMEGDAGSEWINRTYSATYGTVNLGAGIYRFAVGHLEGTGNSFVEAQYRTPPGAGPTSLTVIHPGDASQSRFWLTESPLDTTVPGTHTITYTVTDGGGNSVSRTRTVEVLELDAQPIITLLGRPIQTHAAGTDFIDPGVTLVSVDGDPLDASLVKVDGLVDTDKPGEYTLTYWYYDENGIPADRVSRLVKVVDFAPPTLELQGDAEMVIILGQPFVDPGVTVTDNVDSGLVAGSTEKLPTNNLWMHLDASNIPGVSPGDVLIQWTDISGNGNHLSDVRGDPVLVADALGGKPVVRVDGNDFLTATQQVQRQYSIFTVSQLDGTMNGRLLSSRDINWFIGYEGNVENVFHAEGYVAYFNSKPATIKPHLYSAASTGSDQVRFFADGREIVEDYRRNGRIGMFQIGGYLATTQAAAGDVAEVLIYNNYAVTDQERLSIEALLSLKYNFPGFPDHTPPDLTKLGEHEILYIAQDSSGNRAFATRKITIVPNPDLPVILLLGDSPMQVEAGSTFIDPGTMITDGAGNELVGQSATPANTIDTSVLGIHTLVYNYAEPGLDALPVERKVIVVDTLAPVITLEGDTDIRIKVGEVLTDPGFSAIDQYEGNIRIVIDNPSPDEGYIPGLLGGGLWGYTSFEPNPGNLGVDPIGPSLAFVNDDGINWQQIWTAVYTGQIYDEDGLVQFYENINNRAILTVGGVQLLDNATWDQSSTQSHDFGAGGWFDFELRMGNDGGAGGMTGNIGFGISPNSDGNFVQAKNSDADTMDLFRVWAVDPTLFIANVPGSYTITYTATDSHGNTSSSIRNIVVVEDDTQPYLVLNGDTDMLIEATAGATFTDPKAVAKAADGTILATDIAGQGTVDPTTPGIYQLVYRYTHTDDTVLKAAGRTITVVDSTPPKITLSGDSSVKVFVNGTYTDAGASATDALDGVTGVVSNLEVISGALLHEVYHLPHDFLLLDLDQNGGLLAMEPDGVTLFREGKNGRGIDFLSDQDFRDAHFALQANDNYQNLFLGTFSALRDGEYNFELADANNTAAIWLDKDKDGIFERNGEAGDEQLAWVDLNSLAANVFLSKGTYRFALIHSESTGGSMLTARFSAPAGAGPETLSVIQPGAQDQVAVWATLPMSIDTSKPGHYKVIYYAEDHAGNLASVARTVIVEEDMERPVITLLGADTVRLEAGNSYSDPGVLLDNYLGQPLDERQVVISGVPSGLQLGNFVVSYNFTDLDGHVADTVTRNVIVEDTQGPVINLLGANPATVQVGQPFHDAGALAFDILDGDVAVINTSRFISHGLVLHLDATSLTGLYQDSDVVTQWHDISGKGNHADNILGDPTFVATSSNGLPAVNFDGDDLIWTSTDFEPLLPNYTIFGVARYTGGDSERIFSTKGRNWLFAFHTGNTGRFYAEGWVSQRNGGDTDWHHHTVTANNRDQASLWMDNTLIAKDHNGMNDVNYRPKVIQLGGHEDANQVSQCEVSEIFVYDRVLSMSEIGLIQKHLDNKYNLNGGSTFTFAEVDTSQPGEHTVYYLASDSRGHTSQAERTVFVVDEPDLPVILLTGDPEVIHEAGDPYIDEGATIQNAQNGEEPVVTGSVNVLVPGVYILAYDFTNVSGKTAATVIRKVTVVDQSPPVITLVGGDTLEHQLGNPFVDPGFSAVDSVDGEIGVVSSALTLDQLQAKGFMITATNDDLELVNGGGLLAFDPAGSNLFRTGPDNLGIFFNSHQDFQSLNAGITSNDNFQLLIEGHFHTSTGGRYEFGIENPDDRAGFWLDVDNDGKFERNGDFGPEIMNPDWIYGYRQVDLAPGFYRFAISFREATGGSSLDARYRALSGEGPGTLTRIYPGSVNQEGQWLVYNPINVLAPGEHSITYTAMDSHGNEAVVTRRVIIRNNPEAALLTLLGDAVITLPLGGTFTDPGVEIKDLDGNAIAGAEAVVDGAVDLQRPGRYLLTYKYSTQAGVPSRVVTRKVFVEDQTPPAITLNGDSEITIFQGASFSDPGATALDNYDGKLPVGTSEIIPSDGLVLHLDASTIHGKADGALIHLWYDSSGAENHADLHGGQPSYVANSLNGKPGVHFDGFSRLATSASFGTTYSIIAVSHLTGGSNQRLLSSLDTDWALGYDAGYENVFYLENGWATDAVSMATLNPHLYSAKSGGRKVRFYADGRDLTSFPTRRNDSYAIGQFQMGANLNGISPAKGDVNEVLLYDREIGETERISIEARLNAKYSLNGVEDANVPVNTAKLGTYHIIYQAMDGAGNLATARRTITVAPDPNSPTITLAGDELVHHEAGTDYIDAGATLKDKDGNDLPASLILVNNPVDTQLPGQYTVTYNYQPPFEKPAAEVIRTVIVQDTLPPVITLNGNKVIKIGVGETYTDPGATATDVFSGDLPAYDDSFWQFGRMDRLGYKKDGGVNADLNLDGNGGLLAMTPVGSGLIINGPANRGFDYNNESEFWGSIFDVDGQPVPAREDDFQMLFTAYFLAQFSGAYEFGIIHLDGALEIWLDLDQDEVFESAGDNGNERIKGDGTGWASLDLTAGIYRFAIAYREGTAGEGIEAGFSKPGLIRQRIHPSRSDQQMNWALPNPNPIDTSAPGTYTITYSATDGSGFTTTETRTVIVVADTSLPFIAIKGGFEMNHQAGTPFTDPGAIVTDSAGDELESNLIGVGTVDVNTPGEYILTYQYTNALDVTRKVIVIDTTPPALTLKPHPTYGGTETVTFTVGNPWVDPGIDVQDNDSNTWYVNSRDYVPNQLDHAGFLIEYDTTLLNFANEGGLLALEPAGTGLFTSGALGRGYDYDSYADVRSEPIGLNRDNNLSSYITGYFHARVDGNYTFDSDKADADISIWLDLDQDGNFSRSNLAGMDERLTFDNANKQVFLTEGYYRFIGGHAEGSGSTSARFRIQTPEGAGPSDQLTVLKPSDPSQAGLWNTRGTGVIDPTFPGTYHITYYAFDSTGNHSKVTRTVIIQEDPDAPVLTLVGEPEVQHQQGSAYSDQLPTIAEADGTPINDQVSILSTVTLNSASVSEVEGNNPGTYRIEYNYTDSNSRKAIPVHRTVLVGDFIPPVITIHGDNPFNLPPGFDYTDAGATAEDGVDGNVPVVVTGDVINTAAEATHTVTYTASDAAGNTATETRTVIIKDDLNRPVITLVDGRTLTHEAGEPFVDPGASVANGRGVIFDEADIVVVGAVDHTLLGDYTITYDYSKDGKTAPTVKRVVSVVDTTPPAIELTDGGKLRVNVGATWQEPGYTVTDNLDLDPPVTVIFETTGDKPVAHWEFDETDGTTARELMNGLDGTLVNFLIPPDSWVPGKYGNALKFVATDSSYVTVPPTDKLDLQIYTISVWVLSDDYSRSMFIFEKTANNLINSQYNLYFEDDNNLNFRTFGIDSSDNLTIAPSVANLTINQWQHITVTYDGLNKLIYINGELQGTGTHDVELSTGPAGPSYIGAFAPGDGYHFNGLLDDLKIYDKVIPEVGIPEIQKRSGVDTSVERKDPFTLSYTSTDTSGNTTQVLRKVVVSNDTTPPEITLNGESEVQIAVGDTYEELGATAMDNQDLGVITAFIRINGTVDTTKAGTYTLTYDVEDLSFNPAVQVVRTVIVGTPSETDNLAQWVIDHLSSFPSDQQQELDDPDNDLIENLAEYALGGNPALADSMDFLPVVSESGGKLTVTFLRLKTTVDSKITYRVELTTSLSTPNWSDTAVSVTLHPDQTGVPANYEKITATAKTASDATDGKQFIRIVIDRE